MTDKDVEYADYPRRKAERKQWPEWTETDLWGNRIFPCSNIFEQTIPIEPPQSRSANEFISSRLRPSA